MSVEEVKTALAQKNTQQLKAILSKVVQENVPIN